LRDDSIVLLNTYGQNEMGSENDATLRPVNRPAAFPVTCFTGAKLVSFGALTVLLFWMATLPAAQVPTADTVPKSKSKYQSLNAADVLTNRILALDMAERTQRTIVPTMHLIETEHFLIFSAWNVSNDPILAGLCEQMYQKLVQQFAVPASASVWIGKCPIYVFWDPQHYGRFIAEIDQSQKLDPNMSHANGYHASRGTFSYVVINGVSAFGANQEQAKIKFYHVLIHEGTHAFLHRYVTDRPLPLWVEEGVADYIAAVLVPQSSANITYLTATRSALHDPGKLRQLLRKNEDLSSEEYGLAQSLVRFLVMQSPAAMIHFIEELKDGESQTTALTDSYHATNAELIQGWSLFWQRALAKHG
jgi:hypothetical protein